MSRGLSLAPRPPIGPDLRRELVRRSARRGQQGDAGAVRGEQPGGGLAYKCALAAPVISAVRPVRVLATSSDSWHQPAAVTLTQEQSFPGFLAVPGWTPLAGALGSAHYGRSTGTAGTAAAHRRASGDFLRSRAVAQINGRRSVCCRGTGGAACRACAARRVAHARGESASTTTSGSNAAAIRLRTPCSTRSPASCASTTLRPRTCCSVARPARTRRRRPPARRQQVRPGLRLLADTIDKAPRVS